MMALTSDAVSMADPAESDMLRPRSYQLEMLEESMKQNIIVAMDTGSGKTHIAVMRIQRELLRCRPDQLAWFIAPKVVLCEQQHRALLPHLSSYQHRLLLGKDGVDYWKDQRLWDSVLTDVRVVVSTPQVLLDALSHGYVNMSKIALLVFDEAHRCAKGDPMNEMMYWFHNVSDYGAADVPHVLALTASPIGDADPNMLLQIERNLRAVVKTPLVHREEMSKHVHRPHLMAVTYQDVDTPWSSLLAKLDASCISYDFWTDPYVESLLIQDDPESEASLEKAIDSKKTYCYQELKALRNRALELERQLGRWASYWYLDACRSKLKRSNLESERLLIDMTINEKGHLASLLDEMMDAEHYVWRATSDEEISHKAARLLNVLAQEDTTDFRGLVFVQQRASVAALAHLLTIHPLTSKYKVGSFVGCSDFAGRKTGITDLADPRGQESDLEDFRSGEKNLIVSTNVLEEGIDVPACNMVICYDSPETLISFVQRRGRARQSGSDYMVFYGDTAFKVREWERIEYQITQMYLERDRELQEQLALEDIEETSDRHMRIASTGALLTLSNAPSHLYHFCATLGGSAAHNKPTFSIEETFGEHKIRRATVTLPTAIDPDLRVAVGQQYWRTEKAARRDAAFEAFVALYESRLVNDNLMPVHCTVEEDEELAIRKTPSLVDVSPCYNPWLDIAQEWTKQSRPGRYLQLYDISLFPDNVADCTTNMKLLMPVDLPQIDAIRIYWSLSQHYEVGICKSSQSSFTAGQDSVRHYREATHLLYASVMAGRLNPMQKDFIVLALPDLPLYQAYMWTDSAKGAISASIDDRMRGENRAMGLINDVRQAGAKFIFEEFVTAAPSRLHGHDGSASEEEYKHKQLCFKVRKLPKRRDFLHAVPDGGASKATISSTTLLPVNSCSIDKMPLQHSRFALFAPSVLHVIEINLVAQHLIQTVLAPLQLSSQQLILTAICASSAREQTNYQRLEFLGDCVLKLSTSLQLMALHPLYPESFLVRKKDRIVTNKTLTTAALNAGLDKYIITKAFTGAKWRPQYISETLQQQENQESNHRAMSTKTLADVVESLIGATFLDSFSEGYAAETAMSRSQTGLAKALSCIQLLLTDSVETWLPILSLHETLLASSIRHSTRYRVEHLASIEDLLDYSFTHKSLLLTAMTHHSYDLDQNATSYQRLEFLGDAVLDYVVTTHLYAHDPPLTHQQLHTTRTALVNADFLAYLCLNLVIGETRAEVVRTNSCLENRKESPRYATQTQSTTRSLSSYILHSSASLRAQINTAQNSHATLHPKISTALRTSQSHPWSLLAQVGYPKVLSDIIESILGAVYIDSLGDMQACANVLKTIGLLPYGRRILNEQIKCMQPKEELGILAGNNKVRYVVRRDCGTEVDSKEVGEEGEITGLGRHVDDEGRGLLRCDVYLYDPVTAPEDGVAQSPGEQGDSLKNDISTTNAIDASIATQVPIQTPLSHNTTTCSPTHPTTPDLKRRHIATAHSGKSRLEIETRAADLAIAVIHEEALASKAGASEAEKSIVDGRIQEDGKGRELDDEDGNGEADSAADGSEDDDHDDEDGSS